MRKVQDMGDLILLDSDGRILRYIRLGYRSEYRKRIIYQCWNYEYENRNGRETVSRWMEAFEQEGLEFVRCPEFDIGREKLGENERGQYPPVEVWSAVAADPKNAPSLLKGGAPLRAHFMNICGRFFPG